jgi:hypothetical protein
MVAVPPTQPEENLCLNVFLSPSTVLWPGHTKASKASLNRKYEFLMAL